MRTALLLMLALAAPVVCSTAAAADVWKWVDENGITHYSDQPVAGATKIEVRTGNVVGTSSSTYSGSSASSSSPAGQPAVPSYRNFEIWRPEPNQSFINTAGAVNVEIRIEPAVSPLHQLNVYLDGKLLTGFPRNALSYALTELARGTHMVNAVVTDQSGKVLAEAPMISFTVRQESIAQPPVGPSLRPPPKPTPRAGNKMTTTQPSYGALNGGARTAIDPATNLPVVKKPAPKPGKP
jgi:Domain of unknown function (DUF4124)